MHSRESNWQPSDSLTAQPPDSLVVCPVAGVPSVAVSVYTPPRSGDGTSQSPGGGAVRGHRSVRRAQGQTLPGQSLHATAGAVCPGSTRVSLTEHTHTHVHTHTHTHTHIHVHTHTLHTHNTYMTFSFPPLPPPVVSRCCTRTCTWTARNSGRCLTARCITV